MPYTSILSCNWQDMSGFPSNSENTKNFLFLFKYFQSLAERCDGQSYYIVIIAVDPLDQAACIALNPIGAGLSWVLYTQLFKGRYNYTLHFKPVKCNFGIKRPRIDRGLFSLFRYTCKLLIDSVCNFDIIF